MGWGNVALLVGALSGLAACQAEPEGELLPDPGNNQSLPADLPDADINASLGEFGAAPPLPDALPRFVGRWATDEKNCETLAWSFTADGLETPAGSVCRFRDVREVPGGYDIDASCTAESPEQDDLIELRFAQSARGMLFESRSIADAGLIRCGEPDSEGGQS